MIEERFNFIRDGFAVGVAGGSVFSLKDVGFDLVKNIDDIGDAFFRRLHQSVIVLNVLACLVEGIDTFAHSFGDSPLCRGIFSAVDFQAGCCASHRVACVGSVLVENIVITNRIHIGIDLRIHVYFLLDIPYLKIHPETTVSFPPQMKEFD